MVDRIDHTTLEKTGPTILSKDSHAYANRNLLRSISSRLTSTHLECGPGALFHVVSNQGRATVFGKQFFP